MFKIGQRVKVVRKGPGEYGLHNGKETIVTNPNFITPKGSMCVQVAIWHSKKTRLCRFRSSQLVPLDKPQLGSMEEIKKLSLGIGEMEEV